jgi:ribonuclease PH
MRSDGRESLEVRNIEIETGYQPLPEGSALITWGETRVLCSATLENRAPFFLNGTRSGWVTAEYDMLPGSGNRRIRRDRGVSIKGRTLEIQRIIGRSLRQALDLQRLGERTITVDCDVLVADGGTRVASIVGGCVAVRLAIKRLLVEGRLTDDPFRGYVGAVSLGLIGEDVLVDLSYDEDSGAVMDMNVVADSRGRLIELQASAEGGAVPHEIVSSMTGTAIETIISQVIPLQMEATSE